MPEDGLDVMVEISKENFITYSYEDLISADYIYSAQFDWQVSFAISHLRYMFSNNFYIFDCINTWILISQASCHRPLSGSCREQDANCFELGNPAGPRHLCPADGKVTKLRRYVLTLLFCEQQPFLFRVHGLIKKFPYHWSNSFFTLGKQGPLCARPTMRSSMRTWTHAKGSPLMLTAGT